MPLPKSRGHMLVDLVKPKENLREISLPSIETFSTELSSHSHYESDAIRSLGAVVRPNNEVLESSLGDASLPNIYILEQDLLQPIEFNGSRYSGLFSDIESEGPSALSPAVIEFIDQTENSLAPGIVLDLATTATTEAYFPTIQTSKEPAESEHDIVADKDLCDAEFLLVNQEYNNSDRGERNKTNCDNIVLETSYNDGTDKREKERMDLEDPDFIPETRDSEESERDEGEKGRLKSGRKRKYPNQNRHIRKVKANTNKDYVSAKGNKVSAKEFLGNNFNCSCPRKCTEKLTVEQRENEFKRFWSSGSYEARCAILLGSVKEAKKKRSYSLASKRAFTRRYCLAGVEICKKAFLKTLGISQSRIDIVLKKFKSQAPVNDNRGINSGGRNAISQEQLDQIKRFIESLPKYTSHYCRNNTTSNYLAPNLNLAILYDLYKEKHENHVSLSRFKQCFYKDFNLKFKKPQKDTCFRCDRFKASITGANSEEKELLEKEHKEHIEHAYKLRDQMKKDLARAKTDDSLETLTFDLEKTHCLPRLPTSIVYYKRQLNLHNLGIHCGSTAKGYFYIWLEHEAGRGTQEVGSCIKKFVSTHLKPSATELILWADSCGGQNRSIKMTLMLLHILHNNENLQKITLRFLQPGHTYLPNDSEFGDVECALKNQIRLYTADDYISVMENCRRKNKFTVTRLQRDDFNSVEPILERITNRKIDMEKKKISWMTTFEIELRKDDTLKLFMKSKLEDDFKVVDISKGAKGRKTRPNFEINLPVLYPNGRELSSAKVKDLKEMMKLIPADAKPFYNFIKNVRSSDFTDDTEGFGNTIDFDVDIETILEE